MGPPTPTTNNMNTVAPQNKDRRLAASLGANEASLPKLVDHTRRCLLPALSGLPLRALRNRLTTPSQPLRTSL
eukprot:7386333-Prymnesium_polylepis.1